MTPRRQRDSAEPHQDLERAINVETGQDAVVSTLHNVFNYTEFRLGQREVIDKILSGQDGVALMPTGGGKTLCFGLPAVVSDGLTIVVEPTLALIQDMNERFQGLCEVISLTSENAQERDASLLKLVHGHGNVKIVFTTPETLLLEPVFSALSKCNVARVVVDEVHCLDEWGHQFRPSYLCLGKLKTKCKLQIVGLTATATKTTIQNVSKILKLEDPFILQQSFHRSNLKLITSFTSSVNDKFVALNQTVQSELCTIVYCLSPSDCNDVCSYLHEHNKTSVPYHGGISPQEKNINLTKWLRGEVNIIVATKSLGMGIDKPNVRLIIHFSIPSSLHEYFQQIGRAGRDGKKSDCVLFYRFPDRSLHLTHLSKLESVRQREICFANLRQMISFCISHTCLKLKLLEHFGEPGHDGLCNEMCSACENSFQEEDITNFSRETVLLLHGAHQRLSHVGVTALAKIIKGSKDKTLLSKQVNQLPLYGFAKKLTISAIEDRLINLWVKEILHEEVGDTRSPHLTSGRNAPDVLSGNAKVFFHTRINKH